MAASRALGESINRPAPAREHESGEHSSMLHWV
jgi:hypothetical protein